MDKKSEELLSYLMNLSYLELSSEEKTKLSRDISEIINFMKEIDSVDVSDVSPTYHVQNLVATRETLRDDVVIKGMDEESFFLNVKKHEENQVMVPSIIEMEVSDV